MPWPAVVKGILSVVSLLGSMKNKKEDEKGGNVNNALKITDLIGDLAGKNRSRENIETYASNPTFKSFLSDETPSSEYINSNVPGRRYRQNGHTPRSYRG